MTRLRVLLGVAILLLAVLIYSKPERLQMLADSPRLPDDLDRYLTDTEAAVDEQFGLIPETAKRIRWFKGDRGSKTPIAIVYLHGFSATRQEVAPPSEAPGQ